MELGPPFQFHLFDEPVQIIRLITTTYKQTPEICLIDFLASSQVFTVKFKIDSTEFDDLIELWLAHIEPVYFKVEVVSQKSQLFTLYTFRETDS